jgi:hypothetical protein
MGMLGYDCGTWKVLGKCECQWSKDCLTRQLAKTQERIKALEVLLADAEMTRGMQAEQIHQLFMRHVGEHSQCHDVTCSGSRNHPRGEPGVCCSCRSDAEKDEQIAAMTPVMRAAMRQERAISLAPKGEPLSGPVRAVYLAATDTTEAAVRALSPEQRKAMEEV